MPLVRATARPLLAAMFVTDGLDAVLHPKAKASAASRVSPAIRRLLPVPLPEDPVQLVRINGGVQLAAGLCLATGRVPRLAAFALAATMVPATIVSHPFGKRSDEGERAHQQQFTKNLSMLGGLILASVDLEGRPGLRHRGHDAVRELKHTGHDMSVQAAAAGKRARRTVPIG